MYSSNFIYLKYKIVAYNKYHIKIEGGIKSLHYRIRSGLKYSYRFNETFKVT